MANDAVRCLPGAKKGYSIMYRLYWMSAYEDVWQLEFESDHLNEVCEERNILLNTLAKTEKLKIVRVTEIDLWVQS